MCIPTCERLDLCKTRDNYFCPRSFKKIITEKREILNRWTKYYTELYNHKANGNPSVLDCLQTDTEDNYPILRREVEAAVQSLKKGKSAGFDNIPVERINHRSHDNLQ